METFDFEWDPPLYVYERPPSNARLDVDDQTSIYITVHEIVVESITTHRGDNMYEMAILELENKAKRQRENLKATEEMIAGLRALNNKNQIPLPMEEKNATQAGQPPRRGT